MATPINLSGLHVSESQVVYPPSMTPSASNRKQQLPSPPAQEAQRALHGLTTTRTTTATTAPAAPNRAPRPTQTTTRSAALGHVRSPSRPMNVPINLSEAPDLRALPDLGPSAHCHNHKTCSHGCGLVSDIMDPASEVALHQSAVWFQRCSGLVALIVLLTVLVFVGYHEHNHNLLWRHAAIRSGSRSLGDATVATAALKEKHDVALLEMNSNPYEISSLHGHSTRHASALQPTTVGAAHALPTEHSLRRSAKPRRKNVDKSGRQI